MKTLRTLLLGAIFLGAKLSAAQLGIVDGVETQPLVAQVKRLVSAMDLLGEPFDVETKGALKKTGEAKDGAAAIQRILDTHCLFSVTISPEARVKVKPGTAKNRAVWVAGYSNGVMAYIPSLARPARRRL